MSKVQSISVRRTSHVATRTGVAVLILGGLLGWTGPLIGQMIAGITVFGISLSSLGSTLRTPIHEHGIDTSGFLQADVAALAVIIAVIIGFNVTMIQIAGETLSLALVKSILRSVAPFLIGWGITSTVALGYFLVPPQFVLQLWQILLWFVAIVLLMIGYLWNLSWHLSGQYAARLATHELQHTPIAQWNTVEGYAILQSSISSATARGELIAMNEIALRLANFLVDVKDVSDRSPSASIGLDRARYRVLKNLLTGCAQHIDSAPNPAAFAVGFIAAGISLRAIAIGLSLDESKWDIFSGLFKIVHGHPERLPPLFTGMRHGLCGHSLPGKSYLVRYWSDHSNLSSDDPQRVMSIANAIALMHRHCWRGLLAGGLIQIQKAGTEIVTPNEQLAVEVESDESYEDEEARGQDATMLVKLYRDIADDLAPAVEQEILNGADSRMNGYPRDLLKAVQERVKHTWYPWASSESKARVDLAFKKYWTQLGGRSEEAES